MISFRDKSTLELISDLGISDWTLIKLNRKYFSELEERGRQKCARYWPDNEMGPMTYGDFTVVSSEVNQLAHWSIIKLQLIRDGKTKIVHHLKFHAWPDCGVPEFPAPFLAFLER